VFARGDCSDIKDSYFKNVTMEDFISAIDKFYPSFGIDKKILEFDTSWNS
jgi:hypothetical protein